MKYLRYSRQYVGPVKAVVLDWCGTTVDKYSLAPIEAFRHLFQSFKCPISVAEARADMGIRKDKHIAAILANDAIRQRWEAVYRNPPSEEDILAMFKSFVPVQLQILPKYATLLPGTMDTVNHLRNDLGCKIGMTTGFYRAMSDVLLQEAKKQGYQPDADVAGDEVRNGSRPNPHMLYKNLDLLNVAPIEAVVKADDSVDGVCEALNAGCWGVGVARYSTYMSVDSLEQEQQLSAKDIEDRLEIARHKLHNSGAHYVIDTLAELPEVIADINCRLAKGEKP